MWTVELTNIAGIRRGRATLSEGLNVVQASNWQGKSSFVAGIETVMGTKTALTEGTDSGTVTLETTESTVTTELVRDQDRVVRRSDPYLDDEVDRACAELFAFLSADNPIRTAVRQGENLESALTRPLDLENLDERIAEFRQEREAVESRLEEADRAAQRLPDLEARVNSIESDLEDLRERRTALAEDADEGDQQASVREELSDRQAERDQLASRIEQLEDRLETTEAEIAECEADLDALSIPETGDLESRIESKRERQNELQRHIDVLTDLYNANRRVLEEAAEFVTDVDRGISGDDLTCWVCGETSDRDSFETHLDELDEQVRELRSEASTIEAEVSDLVEQRRESERARREKRDLEDRLADLRSRRDDYQAELRSSRSRLSDLEDDVAGLQAELDELETDAENTSEALTDVESEIKYKESELEDVTQRRSEAEAAASEREDLRAQREEYTEQIEELRNRRERLKRDARDAFDEAMEDVLAVFEPGFEHARLTSSFDVVVARDGREVGRDALSEGEVELLGLVAALAGYEAFDVADAVPVILLDELGGLASEHLHHLVEYLSGRSRFLVITAYPEAGEFEGNVVSPEEWTVVTDDVETGA